MEARKLAEHLGLEVRGEESKLITGVCSIASPRPDNILFIRDKKYLKDLSDVGAVLIKDELDDPDIAPARIISNDPQRDFLKVLELFFPVDEFKNGISDRAYIERGATVSPNARVDAFATISEGSIVSEKVWIGSGVHIGEHVLIGAGTRIHPNVVIYDGTLIGRDVIIHANSTIGADGFGYLMRDGEQIKIPQVGKVMIGNNVEIGANVTIDRAALDSTIVGDGTKIDNLVQIAHNCEIGKGCAISAQVGLSGHTVIGDTCLIGGQVGSAGHLSVGNNSVIYAQSGLAKSFPEGSTIFGTPAKDFNDARRELLHIMRLPKMLERIKKLEDKS